MLTRLLRLGAHERAVLPNALLIHEPISSAHEQFWAEFREPLRDYAYTLQTVDSEIVVAISRKAPRLLQLVARAPDMPAVDLSRCVSEKALAFLAPESLAGRRVSVTDDTILYGSTFTGVERRLSAAGARTAGHVLALSTAANEQVTQRIEHWSLRLNEARVHELIDLEIQAFGALSVPYDIDHPILTVPFVGGADEQVHRLLEAAPGAFEVTRPWQSQHDVRVITLPITDAASLAHSQRSRQMGPRKFRAFVDNKRKNLRLVSIYCLGLRTSELTSPMLFDDAPPAISGAWHTLLGAVLAGGGTERERYRALAQAAHWLASAEMLHAWISAPTAPVDVVDAGFDGLDLQLLFGPALAPNILQPMQALMNEDLSVEKFATVPSALTSSTRYMDLDAELAALAANEQGAHFLEQATRYLVYADHRDAGDLAHSLFNAQRQVYDVETRQGAEISPDRLEDSLIPFPLIPRVLERLGEELPPGDFEEWADRAIDGGSVVPHYHPSLSEPDLWVRCIRAGERRNMKLKYWLRTVLRQAITDFNRHHPQPEEAGREVSTIPWYVAEKVVATVVKVLEPQLREDLGKPIICGRDEFGARAVLPERNRNYLLDWALDCRIIERREGVTRRGARGASGQLLSLPEAFDDLFPPAGDTVGRNLRQLSRSLVQTMMAVEASFRGEPRNVALLALSTCGSHEDLLESISAELDVWLYSPRFGASQIAADLVGLARGRTTKAPAAIARNLGTSATAVKQSQVKVDAYSRRVGVRDHLDELAVSDARMAPHAAIWDEYLRHAIDGSEPQDRRTEQYLLHAANLAGAAISLARTALDHVQGTVTPDHPLERYVRQLNGLFEYARTVGLHYQPPPELDPAEYSDAANPQDLIFQAAHVLQAVEGVVQEIWGAWQRPVPPAAMEVLDRDVAILMWDIVGSSDQDARLQEVIHTANERLAVEMERRGGSGFTPDQNDGNAVVLFTVTDAVEIFEMLSEHFASLGYAIRGGVETTVDAEKIWRNAYSKHYGGKPYQKAARIMEVFKESDGAAQLEGTDGAVRTARAPQRSHLSISARALEVLDGTEMYTWPTSLEKHGVIRQYQPRAFSTLPVDVHCYVVGAGI